MPASIRPCPRTAPAGLPALVVLACGLTWGLGLARALYERLAGGPAWLGRWPGTLALAGLAAALAAGAWLAAARLAGVQRVAVAPAFFPLALPLIALLDSSVHPLRLIVLLVAGPAASLYLLGVMGHESRFAQYASRTTRFVPAALTFFIPFLLYLRTLAPTVGEADTFEFQVDSLRLAVAHPSGYPLYILIGKLFSLLPLPASAAYRINLSSAFFGAVAALGVYALVEVLQPATNSATEGTGPGLGASRMAAMIAGLTFGLSFGLWSRAVEAEVYTLHSAFVAAILWVLVCQVSSKKAQAPEVTNSVLPITHVVSSSIPLLGLLLGLSLTNHLTTALLFPAVAMALLIARPRLPWRTWLLAGGLFVLGLSVYLYIPIRWPAVNGGEVMSLGQFVGYVTGQQAQGALRLNAWLVDPSRYAVVGGKVLGQFGWAGLVLALAGLAWLLIHRDTRPIAFVFLLAYAAYFYFGLSFYVPDPDFSSFLLPAHLIQCVLTGVGVVGVMGSEWRRTGDESRIMHYVSMLAPAILTVALLLPLSLIWRNLPRVDQSQDWGKYELGRTILSQPLARGALLLADSEKIAPLYYLQVAEGARPDLTISVLPDEAAYRAALDEGLAAGRTVYLARYLPGLQSFFHLRSVGPVTEVGTAPLLEPPAVESPLDATFGGAIRLVGVNLDAKAVQAGGLLRFTLIWQSVAPVDRNYLVRLRLLDAAGQVAQETLGRLPANGFYPTNAWQVGEFIPDYHQIGLDAALAPGPYTLEVGLFPPFSDEGLGVEGGTWARVAMIEVAHASRPPAIPTPVRFAYAGASPVRVIGYDLPAAAAPGSEVTASFFWMAEGALHAGGEVNYTLATTDGATVAAGSFDSAAWPGGSVIETHLAFTAPSTAGTLDLRLRVTDDTARCGWLRPDSPDCWLATLKVEGEAIAPGAVNFDDKILLRSLAVDTPQASPGSVVRVTAEWQALATMTEDYTVFVHLIGPDGIVHGQIDIWPVQGTRPTSGWQPGERLRDNYEIRVPDDAPAGDYEIEAGWYLLATLERLPVLGEAGAPVDDRVLQPGLSVR